MPSFSVASTIDMPKVQKKPAARRSAAGKRVRKKPAASYETAKPEVVPVQLESTCVLRETEVQPGWAERITVEHPDWAMHAVRLLTQRGILPTDAQGKIITLTLWVDCGGISTESIALREIKRAIESATGCVIVFKLYCLCDLDNHARRFVIQNFEPAHTS